MAFQQPVKPAARAHPSPADNGSHQQYQELLESRERDTREWVLFSPDAPSIPANGSVITDCTPQTAGLSGASDLESGYLATVASADGDREYGAIDDNSLLQEEDELESLDSHLHAFGNDVARSAMDQRYNATTLLPTHDGYGSFLISAPQEQVKVRGQAEGEDQPKLTKTSPGVQPPASLGEYDDVELARAMRIEAWRLEQSRIVVEKMEKEPSNATAKRHRGAHNSAADEQGIGPVSTGGISLLIQRVLRDVFGIDDYLLAILLGERLPDEDDGASESHRLPAYGVPSPFDHIERIEHSISWLNRLLDRIGRELGSLAQPTLGHHPWVFSVYARYPLADEDRRDQRRLSPRRQHTGLGSARSKSSRRTRLSISDLRPKLTRTRQHSSTTDIARARFFPSISPDVKLLAGRELGGLVRPVEAASDSEAGPGDAINLEQPSVVRTDSDEVESLAQATHLQSELAYWEQRLDVPLVFSFLRNRFRRRTSAASPPLSPTNDKRTPTETHAQSRYPSYSRSFPALKSPFSAPQSQRPQPSSSSAVPVPAPPAPFIPRGTALSRAAAIRHHHPLVPQGSQQQQYRQQQYQQQHGHHASHSSPFPPVPRIESPSLSQGILPQWPKRRGSSSCASESVKSSKRAKATSTPIWDDVGGSHWDWSVGSTTTSTRDAVGRGFLDDTASPWLHATDAATATTGPLGAWVDI